jgi:hypothetical protein
MLVHVIFNAIIDSTHPLSQKLGDRLDTRALIPALMDESFNFMFHLDYLSEEETDDEFKEGRRLVVRRPESRASWVSTENAESAARVTH